MKQPHHFAQLIVSCWAISREGAEDEMTTSHGVMDRALQIACSRQAFPEWVRQGLHFVDSRIGLQCVELPAILDAAQSAELTTAPNPSYRRTQVQISKGAAVKILQRFGVGENDAKEWGAILRAACNEAEQQLNRKNEHLIEDY